MECNNYVCTILPVSKVRSNLYIKDSCLCLCQPPIICSSYCNWQLEAVILLPGPLNHPRSIVQTQLLHSGVQSKPCHSVQTHSSVGVSEASHVPRSSTHEERGYALSIA